MIRSILNTFYSILSPPFCASCKAFLDARNVLCVDCEKSMQPVVSKEIEITATKKVRVISVSDYQAPIKSIILAKRYSNDLASRQLGELIWDKTFVRNVEFDFIVPVPLHWSRRAWRGFNQAENIAKILSKKSRKPVVNLLRRNKRTKYQSELHLKQRYDNVKDVFVLSGKEELYQGKKILIVDDLMTTGSTLKAVSRALLSLKPASLTAVVAARVI